MRKIIFGGLLTAGILGSVIAISRYINKKGVKENNTDNSENHSDKKESDKVKTEVKKEETSNPSDKKETQCKCSKKETLNIDENNNIKSAFIYDNSPALDKDKVNSVQYIMRNMMY